MPKTRSLEERLWSHVDRTGECWHWTGRVSSSGYGQIGVRPQDGGRKYKLATVHRLTYEWKYGSVPLGMELDHMCCHRTCVRPEHLRVVTRKQNMENRAGPRRGSASGARGVTQRKSGRWSAVLCHNYKTIWLGTFDTQEDAAEAARLGRLQYFTHSNETLADVS